MKHFNLNNAYDVLPDTLSWLFELTVKVSIVILYDIDYVKQWLWMQS